MGIKVISPSWSATILVPKLEADMFKGFLLGSIFAVLMASSLFAEPGDYKDLGGGWSVGMGVNACA